MSKPGLPPEKIVFDESVAASTITTTDEEESWLTPNSEASKLFVLKPRGGKATSDAWKYCHLVDSVRTGVGSSHLPRKYIQNPDRVFACCNKCGDLMMLPKKHKSASPKGVEHHITHGKHHTTLLALSELTAASSASSSSKRRQASIEEYTVERPASDVYKREYQRMCVVGWVTDTFQPFQVVEQPSFVRMIQAFDKTADLPDKKKVREMIMNLEDRLRGDLMSSVEGLVVSITMDHWTSISGDNYTGMTIHAIDSDFHLHHHPLGMFLHRGRTTSEALEVSFAELFNKLDLGMVKLFSATTDTEPKMNAFGVRLQGMDLIHLYCTDHVLQLTAREVYEKDTFGEGFAIAVKKARDITNYLHNSSQAAAKLKEKQRDLAYYKDLGKEPVKALQDVCTRWWSTYDMIERLLYLQPAVQTMFALKEVAGHEAITDDDWDNLDMIKDVLHPFKTAQKILEGEKYVTITLIPLMLNEIRKQLLAISSAPIGPGSSQEKKDLAGKLLTHFNGHWGTTNTFRQSVTRVPGNRQVGIHPAVYIACFLDPRTKGLASVDIGKQQIRERVLELMTELEEENQEAKQNSREENAEETQQSSEQQNAEAKEDEFWAQLEQANVPSPQRQAASRSAERIVETEMELYLKLPQEKLQSDPLKWWNAHKGTLPNLAYLARCYLAIPATSAPSERIFSVAQRLIDKKRNRINAEMAGDCLFVADQWKDWDTSDFDLFVRSALDILN
jgi:hypothetical protein